MELHEALASRVAGWRADGYPSERSPAIAEILNFAIENEDPATPFPATGNLRYRLVYRMVFAETAPVSPDAVAAVRAFLTAD